MDFGPSKQSGFFAVAQKKSVMNTVRPIAVQDRKYVLSVGLDWADQKHALSQRGGLMANAHSSRLEPIRLRSRPGWLNSKHWLARRAGWLLALSKIQERSLPCSGPTPIGSISIHSTL